MWSTAPHPLTVRAGKWFGSRQNTAIRVHRKDTEDNHAQRKSPSANSNSVISSSLQEFTETLLRARSCSEPLASTGELQTFIRRPNAPSIGMQHGRCSPTSFLVCRNLFLLFAHKLSLVRSSAEVGYRPFGVSSLYIYTHSLRWWRGSHLASD